MEVGSSVNQSQLKCLLYRLGIVMTFLSPSTKYLDSKVKYTKTTAFCFV